VFDQEFSNEEVFDLSFKHNIEHVLNGYNSTLFAYGMTGTGKTFTIFGDKMKNNRRSQVKNFQKGIIDLIVEELFKQMKE